MYYVHIHSTYGMQSLDHWKFTFGVVWYSIILVQSNVGHWQWTRLERIAAV